jgi:ABC-2 type transport system permease protein
MRNTWTIAKREFNLYFASPIAYISAFLVLLALGLVFYIDLAASAEFGGAPQATGPLSLFVILMLFFAPILTMRLLAEEQRTGTIELLLTAPLREWELVAGKWLAAFAFVSVLIFITALYPLILNHYTQPGLDQGALVAAYVGLFLIAGTMLAIGVFFSTLFSNQIAVYFATMAVLLALWLVRRAFENGAGPLTEVFKYILLPNHYYDNFLTGVMDLSDFTYFFSMIALFLFLAARSVESRRWR